MIWISFGKWSSHSNSMFIWDRVYKEGYKWTPFIMARIRYPLSKLRNGVLDDLPAPLKENKER